MAYIPNTLISRRAYSGTGDWYDDIANVAGSALKVYGAGQQAQGAAAASQQANRDILAAMQAQSGIGIGTVALLGGVGVLAFLLLRRKKPA